MDTHTFIFTPGTWIGEGKVTFSTSSEELHFYTKWEVQEIKEGLICCDQTVEMQGANEHVINHFTLSAIKSDSFDLELKNDLVGKVKGTGVLDIETIGWEFRGESGLEGFETFRKEENGDYTVHAEYASQDQFRSIIDAKLWKKE